MPRRAITATIGASTESGVPIMQASFRNTLLVTSAVVALTCSAAGCGSAGDTAEAVQPASTTGGSSASAPEWADRANGICQSALADDRHELVNHLDVKHVKEHGMSVVAAGSQLDALGPPAGAEATSYARMVDLYKKSAIYHALALRAFDSGDDGNAALAYSLALKFADQADALAVGFGAAECTRFGMDG
jgi:hypothetical protein